MRIDADTNREPGNIAHVRHSKAGTGITTGHKIPVEKNLKNSRNRGRARLSHDISPKPQKMSSDPIFAYFEEEAEKKDGASCVFLIWGSGNSESFKTWAVDVLVTDVENEHDIFDSLATRYYKELGLLQRCLSFRRFSRLKPVTVFSHRFIACLPY